MGETEGKSGGRLAQEGDGALLGFVVLHGKMDRAGAAVDGDIEEALAPLTIGRLQFGQVLDVDVNEAEVVLLERALALGGALRNGLGPAVQALGLEDTPNAVAVEVRQKVADDKGQVIER